MSRRRLLVVDAPGGPDPAFYGPRLPADLDVRVVVAPPGERRAEPLRGRYPVDLVDDVRDLPAAVLRAARDWRADGILTFSERVVHLAAEVARRLGLPANPAPVHRLLSDKLAQREALRLAGVDALPVRRIAGPDDLGPALAGVGPPAVLKPAVGMGSLAVFRVGGAEELERAYREGVEQYGRDPRVAGRPPLFLLERELAGVRWHPDPRIADYSSVDSLVGRGRIVHLAILDKLPLAAPFRETGDIAPSTLPERRRRELLDLAECAIRALGIELGAVHTEIKLTPDGPRILEVNGRCSGPVPNLLAYAAGYDQVGAMARVALGEPPGEPPRFTRHAAFLTPMAPQGRWRVVRAPTADELLALPGVISAEVVFGAGAEPDWRTGASANLARVYAASESWDELVRLGALLNGDDLFRCEAAHA